MSNRFVKIDASGTALADDATAWAAIHDAQLNLHWLPTLTAPLIDTDAQTACAALGARLPTLAELESLRDITLYKPAIAALFAADTKINAEYRTSDSAAEGGAECAWIVSFAYGFTSIGSRSYPLWVRPVIAAS